MTTGETWKTPTCRTCGREHTADFMPRHPYNDGSLSASATFGQRMPGAPAGAARTMPDAASEVVTEAPWPFDPVLRQALIDKGVLTPTDLQNAEAQIRAVTAQFMKGATTDDTAHPVA